MRFTSIGFLATGLAIFLNGCGSTDGPVSENTAASQTVAQNVSKSVVAPVTTAPNTAPNTETSNADISASVKELGTDGELRSEDDLSSPERSCYTFDDGVVSTHLRLTLDKRGELQGEAHSTVENDEAAYYTSYIQVFSGSLAGVGQANVDITTWIEFDVQASSETWTLRKDTLQTEDALLALTDCEQVDPVFQDETGLDARDLLDGASTIHTQRVEFAPGEGSATVSNSVIRGERDVYILGASGGQEMELAIESLEDNAVFDVISPSQLILAREAMDETIYLPHTGDYQVIVGGTRGNASYNLTVGIQ